MAGKREAVRATVAQAGLEPARKGQDPFTGGLRRRAVLPLLVLHLIGQGPTYGNQLMERIGAMTAGVLSVNPNTMYPLLRTLERQALVRGEWEHPDRRSRRFYRLTAAGEAERDRLAVELGPRLDAVAAGIDLIRRELDV
jgi:PadR family transcriptional regulator PadR